MGADIYARLNQLFSSVFLEAISGLFGSMSAFADRASDPRIWATVLAVGLGVRAVKALIEVMADDSGVGALLAAGLRGALFSIVLVGVLNSWDQVQHYGWSVAAGGMTFAGSIDGEAMTPEGDTGQEIVVSGLSILFGKVQGVFTALFEVMFSNRTPDPPPQSGIQLPSIPTPGVILAYVEAAGKNVLLSLLVLIPMLAGLVFVGLLVYEVLTSALMVAVAFMFGPIAVAFYPLVPTWTQNTIGLAASGIARLVITVFLSGAAVRAANTITQIINRPEAGEVSRIQALLTVAILLILMAASVSALVHFSGSIFSSVSGSLGFGRGTRSAVRSSAGAIASADKWASRAGGRIAAAGFSATGGKMMASRSQAGTSGGGGRTGSGGVLSRVGGRLGAYKTR